jgi:hypothetical protein
LIPCSWAEASVLFLLKSKGKSSVLVASSLTRFEAAFRFRLPVLGFLRRFAVCVDQGELSVSAAADVRIWGGIAVRGRVQELFLALILVV